MTFDEEFKEAISHLPSKEKDKLILRLLKKNLPLANRLYFELLDGKSSEERRYDLEKRIKISIERFTNYHFTPGYLMMELRGLSGEITEHVKTTKDKFGEISLNVFMLNEALSLFNTDILGFTRGKTRKLCLYVISKAFKMLVLSKKLHEDLMIELNNELERLGHLISENDHLMRTAIQNGFDVNWLLQLNIPEDIAQIHTDIRNQGYLGSRTYLDVPVYSKSPSPLRIV